MRSTSFIDLITSLLAGLKTNSDSFAAFEATTLNAAKYNGQKIVLQYALNQLFFVLSPPFIIVETIDSSLGDVYVFAESDSRTSYSFAQADTPKTYSVWGFNEADISSVDFVVKIPSGIYSTELDRQIKAQVNIYKVAGTTFTTQQY
jgi:hypothetical protein